MLTQRTGSKRGTLNVGAKPLLQSRSPTTHPCSDRNAAFYLYPGRYMPSRAGNPILPRLSFGGVYPSCHRSCTSGIPIAWGESEYHVRKLRDPWENLRPTYAYSDYQRVAPLLCWNGPVTVVRTAVDPTTRMITRLVRRGTTQAANQRFVGILVYS